MRMRIKDIEAEFLNSGAADLGWKLTLWARYGDEEKFWEQIKTDHFIVDCLIHCIEEDGYDMEQFMELLNSKASVYPMLDEILSGYTKEVPHLDEYGNMVGDEEGVYYQDGE